MPQFTAADVKQLRDLTGGLGVHAFLDFVGIDTTYRIAEIMFDEYKEPLYGAPPLLRKMHLAGYHGRKSGKGFYDYSTDPPTPVDLNL